MKTKLKSYIPLLVIALFASQFLTGCLVNGVNIDSSFDKKYDVGSLTTVDVNNYSGNINISQWSENKIEVKAVKKAWFPATLDDTTITVREDGQFLRIETNVKPFTSGCSVDYTIKVPANFNIHCQTVSGNVDVSGINHLQKAYATSGNLSLRNIRTVGTVETTSGNVRVEILSPAPTADIKTTSGNLELYLKETSPSITTSVISGGVNYHGLSTGSNGRINLKTTSGNIDIYSM